MFRIFLITLVCFMLEKYLRTKTKHVCLIIHSFFNFFFVLLHFKNIRRLLRLSTKRKTRLIPITRIVLKMYIYISVIRCPIITASLFFFKFYSYTYIIVRPSYDPFELLFECRYIVHTRRFVILKKKKNVRHRSLSYSDRINKSHEIKCKYHNNVQAQVPA